MSEKKIKTIQGDAIISLEISGGFYDRIQQVFGELITDASDEELNKIFENIKNREKLSSRELAIETILIFCQSFEEKAIEQGKVTEVTSEDLIN